MMKLSFALAGIFLLPFALCLNDGGKCNRRFLHVAWVPVIPDMRAFGIVLVTIFAYSLHNVRPLDKAKG